MTKVYCDTSNLTEIKECLKYNIDGVTTNPSIMKNDGVVDYFGHCKKILNLIKNKPLSIEVFADTNDEIILQALKISKLGKNVFC